MTEIQRGVYLLKAFQHDGCARTTRVANFRVELPLKFNRASDIMRHEIAFNPFAQRYIYIYKIFDYCCTNLSINNNNW